MSPRNAQTTAAMSRTTGGSHGRGRHTAQGLACRPPAGSRPAPTPPVATTEWVVWAGPAANRTDCGCQAGSWHWPPTFSRRPELCRTFEAQVCLCTIDFLVEKCPHERSFGGYQHSGDVSGGSGSSRAGSNTCGASGLAGAACALPTPLLVVQHRPDALLVSISGGLSGGPHLPGYHI